MPATTKAFKHGGQSSARHLPHAQSAIGNSQPLVKWSREQTVDDGLLKRGDACTHHDTRTIDPNGMLNDMAAPSRMRSDGNRPVHVAE